MKRLLFVALVYGLATVPSLGAPSLGFWEEGAQGTTHMVWDLEPTTVLEIIDDKSFDADTSNEASFPTGIVQTPIGVAIISSTNLTYSNGVFSSPNPIEVHLKMNNFPNLNAFKEVWVDAFGSGTVEPTGAIATHGPALSFTYELLAGPGPGTGADFGWRVQPNPFYEEIELSMVPAAAGALATLDGIHVDTICTPAPGALLLASLGAAAVGWLRARRSI